MNAVWAQFEDWLKENWVEGFEALNPPATDQEILELQESLGVQLPDDFVACLKVHNGQRDMTGGLFEGSEFLSTQAILDQWQVWKELLDSREFDGISSDPEDGIKNDWWNAKWIPFTHNGGGDHYCIDLDPTETGQYGQIIAMWHDSGERKIQSGSFLSWFRGYVEAVLRGQYVYSEDFGGLIDVDDV